MALQNTLQRRRGLARRIRDPRCLLLEREQLSRPLQILRCDTVCELCKAHHWRIALLDELVQPCHVLVRPLCSQVFQVVKTYQATWRRPV